MHLSLSRRYMAVSHCVIDSRWLTGRPLPYYFNSFLFELYNHGIFDTLLAHILVPYTKGDQGCLIFS